MLTDGQASAAQAGDKDYKLADANGLYLFVTKSGFKSWRMKYRFGGKEKRLTFGGYPEVSLAEARERRDQARRLLRDQVDPALERQRLKAAGLAIEEPEVAEEEMQPDLAFATPAQDEAPEPVADPVLPPLADAAPAAPPGENMAVKGFVLSSLKPAAPLAERPVRAGLKPTPDLVPPAERREPATPPDEVPSRDAAREPAPPRVPAEDEPAVAVPFTPEVVSGSRALALLRQAEEAVAEARKESRTAKRFAAAVLALFVVAALGFAWWLAHGRGAAAAPAAAARVAVPASAPVALAHPVPPAVPPASVPPGSAPALTAAPVSPAATPPVSPPSTPMASSTAAGHRPAATATTTGRHHRHWRHRHHARHQRHHALPSTATPTAATRHPHAQESFHEVQVTAPARADSIEPALDRYGRAALCLRAAYSADPGCAALRGAGRQ